MQNKQKPISGLVVALLGALLLPGLGCQKKLSPDSPSAENSAPGIIGGVKVLETDAISKNVVAIYHIKDFNPLDPLRDPSLDRQIEPPNCTGFILTPQIVVTAAHCAHKRDPKNLFVYFGRSLPLRLSEFSGRQVSDYRIPPQYLQKMQQIKNESLLSFDSISDMADMAVLKFEGDLPLGYQPAKILSQDFALSSGMEVTLAGYGVYDPTRSQDIYSDYLRQVQVTIANPHHSSMEISMNQRNKKGSCRGDSGGPAYLMVDGIPQLIGITRGSYRDGGKTCTVFSLYTSLQSMMTFLVEATKGMTSQDATQDPSQLPSL